MVYARTVRTSFLSLLIGVVVAAILIFSGRTPVWAAPVLPPPGTVPGAHVLLTNTELSSSAAGTLAPNDSSTTDIQTPSILGTGGQNGNQNAGNPVFHHGSIQEILNQDQSEVGGYTQVHQTVSVKLENGQTVSADYTLPLGAGSERILKQKMEVVVAEQPAEVVLGDQTAGAPSYTVTDLYRLPSVLIISIIFVIVLIIFAGTRGVTALAGLGFSIWLLLNYLVPNIAHGADPMITSLITAVVIAGIALYLAHGFNRRTTLSLASTLITLMLAVGIAVSFVSITKLAGLGSDGSVVLQYGSTSNINLKGLLLAGIIIGALGVLDDITTAQSAAVEEIHRANLKLNTAELYHRGMSVGKEHITSLVNTLALAYAGASLPLLLLFTVYQQPLWVTLNSEFLIEEVVRTIVGSLALTLAVPISTGIAAYWYGRQVQQPLTSREK